MTPAASSALTRARQGDGERPEMLTAILEVQSFIDISHVVVSSRHFFSCKC